MLVSILFIHMIFFFAHWTAAATNEFSVIHKVGNVDNFVQLLMKIN